MATPVRAVFWDLGGVILRTEDQTPRRLWERRLGLPEGALAEIVFDGEAARRAVLGRATADDVWQEVGARLALSPPEAARLRADFFSADQIDEALMTFIRHLARRVQVGMISNAWPEVGPLVRETWRIADAFEPLILSAEVGLAKPDPRIFQLALSRAGVDAGQAVFVDDFEENLAAARGVGMLAVPFRDSVQAREAVAALLERG